ncbi:hypothetical protein [Providencia rustigianii]|nr:hypothetical protein [Providencia rustigianii]
MSRATLSLKKGNNNVTNPPATNTQKSIQAKTPQEAPPATEEEK